MVRLPLNLFCALMLATVSAGCAGALLAGGAAAGAGGYAYVNGELKTEEPASIDRVWNATLAAAGDLQLRTIESEKDRLNARLHAKSAGDRDIYVKLRSLSETETELRIRIDIFGDEEMSNRIRSEIEQRLSGAPGVIGSAPAPGGYPR